MVDGTVRLVMESQAPGVRLTTPEDGSLAAEQAAEEENRRLIGETSLDDWIPHWAPIDAAGRATGEVRPLLDCAQVHEPATPAGLSTLSVVAFDTAAEILEPTSGAGVVATGDVVYASTDRLIVSTSRWGGWAQPFADVLPAPGDQAVTTDLHTFDIADPAATEYVASGRVDGSIIGQFALSEVDGVIRVATTSEPAWRGGGDPSSSALVVLREDGEQLVETGRVDDLGLTETIQSVRYLSPDLVALITFRITDPLYLIGTSDPANPQLLGELEIPGFSSYLHPVGDGQLLGIGQDADPETGATEGLQASLFDVSDPSAPTQTTRVSFGQGYSPVEGDHRAFLHWTPTGQAFVPAELYRYDEETQTEEGFGGTIVLDVGDGTLAEAGRLSTDPEAQWSPAALRTVVIGDDVWTMSYEALTRHDLASLTSEATVPLR